MTLVRMDQLLEMAEKNRVGCGAFNVGNMEMVRGAIKAAEEEQSPIILQIAEGRLIHSPLELIGPMMINAAAKSKVDIAVHFDHGKSWEKIKEALDMGFTSVMFDGSELPLKKNIEKTNEIAMLAEKYHACLEGELGIIGGEEDENMVMNYQYTEVRDAIEYIRSTKVDALAIAIGNAHGTYRGGAKLNIKRLKEINDLIQVPLVLHGGSGLSREEFQSAIWNGIQKVNIATANFENLTKSVETYVKHRSDCDYFEMSEIMVDSVYESVKKHIRIFNMLNMARKIH